MGNLLCNENEKTVTVYESDSFNSIESIKEYVSYDLEEHLKINSLDIINFMEIFSNSKCFNASIFYYNIQINNTYVKMYYLEKNLFNNIKLKTMHCKLDNTNINKQDIIDYLKYNSYNLFGTNIKNVDLEIIIKNRI